MKVITNIFFILWVSIVNGQTTDSIVLLSSDTLTINHNQYIVQLTENNVFRILCDNDTLIEKDYYPVDVNFIDFNEDGYTDIYLIFLSNTPRLNDLFLFDNQLKCFKKVEGFSKFPDAQRLGKGFYYSYHRSGCADLNWDSDLFYIQDYKAIKVANIHAIGCEDDPKKGIYIYDLTSSTPTIIDFVKLTVIKGNKWNFIRKYWKKNKKKFHR